MKQLFAVIRTRADAWQGSLPLEGQRDWEAHARFMDALHADGFIVIGGPLEGTPDVLLAVRAESEDEIYGRFAEDPWTELDLLRMKSVSPWMLRLGSL
jgi:uncharacterized protein YciI